MTALYVLAIGALCLSVGDWRHFCATLGLCVMMFGSSWVDPDWFGGDWYTTVIACEGFTAVGVAATGSRAAVPIAALSAMLALCHLGATTVLRERAGFDPYPICAITLQGAELLVVIITTRRFIRGLLKLLDAKDKTCHSKLPLRLQALALHFSEHC